MKKNSIPYRIANALVENNIKHIFGIPGTHNIELYDAFREVQELAPVLITDEQSAGFIADGYFRSSGKLACLSLVPGAGLTHALSGIAEAYLDQIPMLVLVCGIRGDSGRKFQLHDIDQLSVARPVTKASIKITDWDQIEDTITKAVKLSLTVPYGPVVLEIPAEGLITKDLENSPQEEIIIPEKKKISSQEIDNVISEINKAQKVGLYIGNLMPYNSNNHRKIVDFVEMLDAKVMELAQTELNASITNLDNQWHYPAGIQRKNSKRYQAGISLVPPRSALWMNAKGERIGPLPLIGNTDSRKLVEIILNEPGQYSWQILNMKIAKKEMAVSGCDYMDSFRKKKKLLLLKDILFGNKRLITKLKEENPEDIIYANSLDELMDEMDKRSLHGFKINREKMKRDIKNYDDQIERGSKLQNDDQLRRLKNFRSYIGDKIRLCKNQKINDEKAYPLIAIREFILSRKTLGGIKTNLNSQILDTNDNIVNDYYAVGEASGFGGGGIHGEGSLEGTFLGSCILTAIRASSHITKELNYY